MARPRRNLRTPPAYPRRYSATAIGLHWLMAILVGVAGGGGWFYATALPQANPYAGTVLWCHVVAGLALLCLWPMRLIWRWRTTLPAAAHHLPRPLQRLSRWVHRCLYAGMLLASVSGWALLTWVAPAEGVAILGETTFPVLPLPAWLRETEHGLTALRNSHAWAVWGLLGLSAIHTLAACFHHLILRDDVLLRITPLRLHGGLHRLRGTRKTK